MKIANDAQDCICQVDEEATELEEQVRRHAEAAGRALWLYRGSYARRASDVERMEYHISDRWKV